VSLGIACKGPEGVVLAADSRVTLTARNESTGVLLPATYDNATKLIRVEGQDYVGAITYGAGAIGGDQPRTAHSFLPELEESLKTEERLSVRDFAGALSDFFLEQWQERMPEDYKGQSMVFLVSGFNEGEAYGRLYEMAIPANPEPREQMEDGFGFLWGGQRQITDRLLQGFDDELPKVVQATLDLEDEDVARLREEMKRNLQMRIPYQFLPLQDCVDLCIFLLRTTIALQTWLVDVRGVGGAIDVATITRQEGFRPVQRKRITGEESFLRA
jgi:hypothetical protein